MRHIVNQIGFRLSVSRFWNLTYSVFYLKDFNKFFYLLTNINKYVNFFFSNKSLSKYKKGLFFSHCKIIIIKYNIFILCFLYDQNRESIYAKKFIFDKFYSKYFFYRFNRFLCRPSRFRKISYYFYKKIVFISKVAIFKKYFNKIFFMYKNFIELVLYKICLLLGKHFEVKLKFFYSNNLFVETSYLVNFLIVKLKNDFNLFRAVKKLSKFLKRNRNVIGFKISCAGRFSRRQRATYHWKLHGKLPLNSFCANVNYSNGIFYTKNGACSIKIWINYKQLHSSHFLL